MFVFSIAFILIPDYNAQTAAGNAAAAVSLFHDSITPAAD
jgi:hypothetical protein